MSLCEGGGGGWLSRGRNDGWARKKLIKKRNSSTFLSVSQYSGQFSARRPGFILSGVLREAGWVLVLGEGKGGGGWGVGAR